MAVEISEPQFDIKTQSVLLKSASWLMHGLILKKIAPYLTYPVKDNLEKVKTQVNTMLSNYPIYSGVTLHGKLNNLSVLSLSLVPGAVRIQANVKGNVALKVEDLKL